MGRTQVPGNQIKDDSIEVKDLQDFAVVKRASGRTVDIDAGNIRNDNTITAKAAQTIVVADDTTSYLELDGDGIVYTNTTGFTSGRIAIATVVAASGDVTTVTDNQAPVVHQVLQVLLAQSENLAP
jgi:translation elongation factor P/translation initiation factor 5A